MGHPAARFLPYIPGATAWPRPSPLFCLVVGRKPRRKDGAGRAAGGSCTFSSSESGAQGAGLLHACSSVDAPSLWLPPHFLRLYRILYPLLQDPSRSSSMMASWCHYAPCSSITGAYHLATNCLPVLPLLRIYILTELKIQREREREIKREIFPCTDLLPKCPEQPMLG